MEEGRVPEKRAGDSLEDLILSNFYLCSKAKASLLEVSELWVTKSHILVPGKQQ
jgi:hypothetical protein